MSGSLEYRIRIRDAANTTDVLVVSTVRGDALPYIMAAPTADGSEFDPLTGSYRSGSCTVRIGDAITSGTSRVLTSQLEDANFRQQLSSRPAYVEFRESGGAWEGWQSGIITGIRLSSAAVYDVDVGDQMRATRNLVAFAPKRDATDATKIEPLATYLARWPHRGTLAGGPVIGGFLRGQDLGGWEYQVATTSGSGANMVKGLRFVAGYAAPKFVRSTNAADFRDALNEVLGEATRSYSASTFSGNLRTSIWRDLVIQVGSSYFAAAWYGQNITGGITPAPIFWASSEVSPDADLYVADPTNALAIGSAIVRVRIFDALPSDRCPIYYSGHPIDLWKRLCDEGDLAYNAGAATAATDALQSGLRINLRITASSTKASFMESVLYGPCGFSVRTNASNELVPFTTRVTDSAAPSLTLTNADVPQGSGVLFDLSEPDAITKVTFNQQNLIPSVEAGRTVVERTATASTTSTTSRTAVARTTPPPDGVTVQSVIVERTSGDTGGPVQREQTYTIPGFIDTGSGAYEPSYVNTAAKEIFDRWGRGRISGDIAALRSGAGRDIVLGQEFISAVRAMPNHNKRLGDDLTVAGRAVQVVRVTPSPTGPRIKFVDSGPNAQPVATLPTLTLAAGVFAGSVLVTVTNAATLNAAAISVRIQWAQTSGAAPAAAAYTDVEAFAPGTIPTTGFLLPLAMPGVTVWVRARSEQLGKRPSNYSSAVSLAVGGFSAPTSLSATPDPLDGGRAALGWTIGANAASLVTDVFIRLSAASVADDVRRITLPAGSIQYELDELDASTSYTASVQHRDATTGSVSAKTTVTFVTSSTVATLPTPVDAHVFAGPQGDDLATLDGSYGLAVVARVVPGSVEFREAIETAIDSGVFGAYVSIARIPAVLAGWTQLTRIAPNDGLLRRLSARSVRAGAVSAWTTALDVLPWSVVILPPYAGPPVPRLLHFAWIDSETERTYTADWNDMVASVHVYDQLVSVGEEDGYGDDLTLPVEVQTAGPFSYTAQKPPQGFQRFLHFVPRDSDDVAGDVHNEIIDPAPSALAATVKAAVSNDTAALTLKIEGGASNWPVTVDLYEDDPDGAPLLSTTVSAPTVFTSADFSVLAARPLPLREVRRWYMRLTDTAGLMVWGIGSADRDALPNGSVTRRDYRADPDLVCTYDDDADQIRVTLADARTKTFTGLSGSGVVTYTVGDALDDTSSETPFATDEVRTPYLVEFEGGGTWVPFFNGPLHGVSSKPPIAHPRFVLSTNRDTADVYVGVESPVAERVRLFVRNSESFGAPEYGLCVGVADPTPLFVSSGSELGPTSYFTDGASQTLKLAAIALTRDQIKRLYLVVEGEDSGVRGSTSIALGAMEQPWLESISANWDELTSNLNVTAKGGAHCASALFEIDDNPSFSSPYTASGALADGAKVVVAFALSGAEMGKVWYARVTPYNLVTLGGLPGVAQLDECFVQSPVSFTIEPTESAGNGTLTVVVADPSAKVHASLRVSFAKTQLGTRTLVAATTSPGSGTSGTYTYTFALDAKHPTLIETLIHMADGSTLKPGAETFDADKVANVVNVDVVHVSGVATITASFDTDTATGAAATLPALGPAQYAIGAGAWVNFAVNASTRVGSFTVTMTGSAQTVHVRGISPAGVAGPAVDCTVGTTSGTTPAADPGFASVSWSGSPDYTLNTIDFGFVSVNVPAGTITYNVTIWEQTLPAKPYRGNTTEFVNVTSPFTYPTDVSDIDAAGIYTKKFKGFAVMILNGLTVIATSATVELTLNSNT